MVIVFEDLRYSCVRRSVHEHVVIVASTIRSCSRCARSMHEHARTWRTPPRNLSPPLSCSLPLSMHRYLVRVPHTERCRTVHDSWQLVECDPAGRAAKHRNASHIIHLPSHVLKWVQDTARKFQMFLHPFPLSHPEVPAKAGPRYAFVRFCSSGPRRSDSSSDLL